MSKVICMYSYKGGAGRTVATANIATILAKQYNQKVICIDMDIEGAGLGIVLEVNELINNENSQCFAVQDILNSSKSLDSISYENHWRHNLLIRPFKSSNDAEIKNNLICYPDSKK